MMLALGAAIALAGCLTMLASIAVESLNRADDLIHGGIAIAILGIALIVVSGLVGATA